MDQYFQIPENFQDKTLDNYVPESKSQETALTLARRLAQNPVKGLFMWGSYGVGKTHLCAALAKELYHQRPGEVWFFRMADLYPIVFDQNTIAFKRKDWPADLEKQLVEIPFLFLEEVFLKDNPGCADFLKRLVEKRYDAHKFGLFMNSNISLDQQFKITSTHIEEAGYSRKTVQTSFDQDLAGRTVSRIHQMCFVYELIGPDHRIEQGKKELEDFLK